MTLLVTNRLPPVSIRFLNRLKEQYPPITNECIIKASKDNDLQLKLLGRAYQQRVINYIEQNTSEDAGTEYRGGFIDRIKYVFNR